MASKLISSRGMKLEKLVYRRARIYVSQQLFKTGWTRNANLNRVKDMVNSEMFKTTVAKYTIRSERILTKMSKPPMKCPRIVSAGRFLTKGCSAAICTVKSREYESELIMKQPYRYDTEFAFTEGKLLAKLSHRHPNVIHCFGQAETAICQDPAFAVSCPDVLHQGITPSLILERMDGNLQELLLTRQADLSVTDRIDILCQILEAEVYMHSQSVCHRDLKPANILTKWVNNSASVFKFPVRFLIKVADFDCALDLSAPRLGEQVTHQGTPDRTPPEILNRSQSILRADVRDAYSKSDVWAIGTLVYELFDSVNPFSQLSAANYSIEDLPPLLSAPSLIQKLVKHLLEPDWTTRYHACIAADILQLFRFKSVVTESIFNLFKAVSIIEKAGCCFMLQMYFAGPRFLANPSRLEFALRFVDEDY